MSTKQLCGRAFCAVLLAVVLGWLGSVEPAAGQAATGHITGTVSAEDGGLALEGICVSAYGGSGAGSGETDGTGFYDIGGLAPGDYTVVFRDCSGSDTYADEYFDDTTDQGAVTRVSVAAGVTTPNVNAGLAAAGQITGTVTADGGGPLEGICVTADANGGTVNESDQTDSNGFYEITGLPAANYRVRFADCSGSGYITEYFDDTASYPAATRVTVTAGATTPAVDASLTAGGHITGTVSADGGGPLEGICVTAEANGGTVNESDQTDSNGFYDIDRLPTGRYRVQFVDCSGSGYILEYFDDTHYDAATLVDVTAGATTPDVDAGLAAGGHITGTVTADDTGLPLADICVGASGAGSGGFTRTRSDGSYDIGGLAAGSYRLYFEDCSATPVYAPEVFDGAPVGGPATPVEVTLGETTADINAGLAVGGQVTGTVTADDGGAPLEGICVGAASVETSDGGSARTASDGTYVIGGLATGRYSVSFSVCGGGPADYVRELFDDVRVFEAATLVDVMVGETISGIDAGLATAGHITGTVTAQDTGLPLEGACVYASDGAGSGGYADTAADGSYDIGGLATGTYTVTIEPCGDAVGYAPEYFDDAVDAGAATLVEVVSGETTAGIDVDLAPGGHITGTVTSEETGFPVEGICVIAFTDDFGRGSGPTGPDGSYDIGGLPAGSHKVQFTDCTGTASYRDEYFDDAIDPDAATPVPVFAGATTSGIDVGLVAVGHITGRVTADDGGLPLEGICVSAFRDGGGGYSQARTEPDGSYDIGDLPSGDYVVHFFDCATGEYAPEHFDDALDYEAATLVPVSSGSTTEEVDAGLATGGNIVGTVTADDGAVPLEGMCVAASSSNGYDGQARTGPDGSYDIGGLPTGSYRVRFSDCDSDDYSAEYFNDVTDYYDATLVSVTTGAATSGIDAGLATSGRITGSVIADQGGVPLEGICVSAAADDGFTRSTETGADGSYAIDGLAAASYGVTFSDCNGTRDVASEYYDDTTASGTQTLVEVASGETTPSIDAGLAAAGHITGTVTADDTDLPLADICVNATRAGSDIYGYGYTAPDGTYDIGALPAGNYTVKFSDCSDTGDYATEFFDNTTSTFQATLVEVTTGATSPEIDAGLATGGHITGTVISDSTGDPIGSICVDATATGFSAVTTTESDGTYEISGLPAGNYTVGFRDCTASDLYANEYFDDTIDPGAATPVSVTTGATTPDIDASLAADGDGDGASALVENGAPNNGDGNNDGTPDAEQGNVASLPGAVGTNPYVTVAAPPGTLLNNLSTIDPASLPELPPGTAEYPAGLVALGVSQLPRGATIEVELTFDGGLGGADQYFKYHDGVWVDYSANAVFSGDAVTLTLTDGGVGDDDAEVNGQIIDPGGPALLTPTVQPPPPPPPPPAPVTCAGREVTVDLAEGQTPTSGPDVIRGTPGADVIEALGGDDVVCSLSGNDTINAGPGADTVFSGGGDDMVRSGNGGGRVSGNAGNDTLRGGMGNDALMGRVGNDRLIGRAGNDRLLGGTRTDTCSGGTGTDTARACESTVGVP